MLVASVIGEATGNASAPVKQIQIVKVTKIFRHIKELAGQNRQVSSISLDLKTALLSMMRSPLAIMDKSMSFLMSLTGIQTAIHASKDAEKPQWEESQATRAMILKTHAASFSQTP